MTQIRLNPQGSGPATHVLIIGVGFYRHLLDGPEPRRNVHLGLAILESPPISAVAVAKWVLGLDGSSEGGLSNPAAPLATVEVLISSRNQVTLTVGGTGHPVERATLPAVRDGFDRWLAEVRSNPENVGVLYFCGHGVMGKGPDRYLLLDDHGAVENRPFETGSFDLSNTLRALWRKVPAQLYVFIDACRTVNDGVAGALGAGPPPLLYEQGSTANISRGATYVEAAGDGMAAYGDSTEVSRFADALLRATKGYSGVPEQGTTKWLVNGEALQQAMPKLLQQVNEERNGEVQCCVIERSGPLDLELHARSHPPRVKVTIDVTPDKCRRRGAFTMQAMARDAPLPIKGGGTDGVWQTEAPRGIYAIKVVSAENAFKEFDPGDQHVDPPSYRLFARVKELP